MSKPAFASRRRILCALPAGHIECRGRISCLESMRAETLETLHALVLISSNVDFTA
jgi:hypothetical protein